MLRYGQNASGRVLSVASKLKFFHFIFVIFFLLSSLSLFPPSLPFPLPSLFLIFFYITDNFRLQIEIGNLNFVSFVGE